MPVKNIIPDQKVTKEKLQRAKELRRQMTPAEKILWEELPPAGAFGGRISWESIFGGSRSLRGCVADFYC
jgi:very-short-patch-repair endonuclease